jgi:hypothetical protein
MLDCTPGARVSTSSRFLRREAKGPGSSEFTRAGRARKRFPALTELGSPARRVGHR